MRLSVAAAIGLAVTAMAFAAPPPISAGRIWLTPGPGTLDYLRLFEQPGEWARAREIVTVFQFYQQHTQMPPAGIVGPNSFDAFVRVGAFRRIRSWGMKTSLEIGSVKEGYCRDDPAGTMEASIRSATESVLAVQGAGGAVDYLAQDEPWVSGSFPVCGGPALEPTADRVARWMSALRQRFPRIEIGLIEAHPFLDVTTIGRILDMLQARGTPPAFLHVDVDWHAMRPGDFARDLPRLRDTARARNITFGVIVWGYNGDADALFARDAADVANLMTEAFHGWEDMPERIIFQSWAESRTGLRVTPANLPEDRPYALTNILLNLHRRLLGASGGATGRARRRG